MGKFKEIFIEQDGAKRDELIQKLLNDFLKQFPSSNRAERVELHARLHNFETHELELLASQLEVKNE